jgi:heme A synthase
VASNNSRAAAGSLVAGVLSVATLPVAIYLTRFSDAYSLVHAGFAIPIAVALGVLAVALARRAVREASVRVTAPRSPAAATAGRVLGIIGLCMAAAALVALGVYGLLEYVGSRD